MKSNRLGTIVLVCGLCLSHLAAQDPWNQTSLLEPDQLAAELKSNAKAPVVLFVGFPVLYRAAHIPDAIMAGPCSNPEGLAALRKVVADVPKSREIVIYCGCCPFAKCPNVRPAFKALQDMGFSGVRVLRLNENFHTDWVQKGYPTDRPNLR